MSDFDPNMDVDFDALAEEIDTERIVRSGMAMLEISETIAGIADTNRRTAILFDEIELLLDALEAKQPPTA
ncbi:MAG: hypothetical protein WAQ57_00600 [Candidatus Saccharimonadales bacterium]